MGDKFVGLVISLLALGLSVFNAYRPSVLAKRQQRSSLDRDRENWAGKVMDQFAIINRVSLVSVGEVEDRIALVGVTAEMSVLIDKGRFLFPNKLADSTWIDEESAYQGRRQEVLKFLVFTHDRIRDVTREATHEAMIAALRSELEHLTNLRRRFVSEVQKLVGARERIDQSR